MKSQFFGNTRFCFRHRALRSIATQAGHALRPWSDDTNTFFTIGHSTRTIVEFVDFLRESGVGLVIDVRSIPRSRTNPQFNQETIPETLALFCTRFPHRPDFAKVGSMGWRAADGIADCWRRPSG